MEGVDDATGELTPCPGQPGWGYGLCRNKRGYLRRTDPHNPSMRILFPCLVHKGSLRTVQSTTDTP